MPRQASIEGQNPKQHKSFRFDPKTAKQLKDIADLFGRSETAMLGQIIETYYNRRVEFFEEDRQRRISGSLNT